MNASATLPLQIDRLSSPPVSKALNRLLRLKPSFSLHNDYSSQRRQLEAYIGQQFEETYGATITEFLPEFLGMQCEHRISAVAGIRPAIGRNLFVEQYIDTPIELAINQFTPSPIQRSEIAEIGNLSAMHRGATILFFIVFAAIMHEAGFKWAVFTATEQLEAIIKKLNFITHDLAVANPRRLGDDASRWGTYYDTSPAVCVGDISATVEKLRQSPLPATVLAIFNDTITDLAQALKNRTLR
jgi:hypothetical protein